jgi:hypothetical protein
MGQQQLLLVILVTIIVGIATVVAINIFGTAAEQANQDAIRQDLLTAATNAQGIWSRPQMMGGVGGDFTTEPPTDEQFASRLGIPGAVDGLEISNENGTYDVTRAATTVTIDVTPNGSPGTWQMTVERIEADGVWVVTITDNEGQDSVIDPRIDPNA